MRSIAIALLFSLLAPSAHAHAADEAARLRLPITRTVLPNGLTVILEEDHDAPVVSVVVRYKVGFAADPPGRSGFAHLFEHLIGSSTPHVPDVDGTLARAGSFYDNAFTDDDANWYVESVPSNQLDVALWLESDRMAFARVDEAAFDTQVKVLENEFRQRYETRAYACADRWERERLYAEGHPYRRRGSDPRELDAANPEEALVFYRDHYGPSDAALVIVGDFERDAAMASVERYFGSLPSHPVVSREPPATTPLKGEAHVDIVADVERAEVEIAWLVPPVFQPGLADLSVLADVLAGTDESRLTRHLVRELQIADEVSVDLWEQRYASRFTIRVIVRPGHTVDEVVAAVDRELAPLRKGPLADDEVARARAPKLFRMVSPLGSSLARASMLAEYWDLGADPGLLHEEYRRLRAVTPESLRVAASTWLPPARRVVTRITPQKGAPLCGGLARPEGGAR
jgi:zinc protease